jgi:hypothetical protein
MNKCSTIKMKYIYPWNMPISNFKIQNNPQKMINSFKNMHVLALSSYKQNAWAPDVHAIRRATCNLWSQHSICITLQQHAQWPKFPMYFVPHNTAGWAWTCTACQTLIYNYCIFWTMQCTKIVSTNLGTKIFDSPSYHKKQDSFIQYFARKTCSLWPGRHNMLCYLQALYKATVTPNLSWQILFEIQFSTCRLHNIHTVCLFWKYDILTPNTDYAQWIKDYVYKTIHTVSLK